jgi:hypothetical protein
MELIAALIVSVLVNFWQFNESGKLEAERDNFRGISEQCTTDRKAERRTSIEAADVREQEAAAMGREFSRQEQHTRDTLKRAEDSCLNTSFVLGSDVVDNEQQATDSLNGVWLRGSSRTNDR